MADINIKMEILTSFILVKCRIIIWTLVL